MSKRIFVLLVVLMVTSLLGIITVQIFWIRSSIEMREEQFSTSVKFALAEYQKIFRKESLKKIYPDMRRLLIVCRKQSKAISGILCFGKLIRVEMKFSPSVKVY